jgi:gamma-glutamylputrescine oxidase
MTTSLWLDSPHQPAPPLAADTSCDVLVIGGGLCGAACVGALARAGHDVVWLEEGRVAGAATGRNAGFVLQGTAERYDRAVALLGRERARRIHGWSLDNHARIAAAAAGIDCAYRRGGSLQLAGSPEEEAELVASAALLQEDGFDAQLLEGEALGAVYRAAGFRLGVLLPADGELDPARFVRGLAARAVADGARLHEGTRVAALDAGTMGDVRAETSGGTVRAQVAVLATNARAAELLPFFHHKVDPVRGQMLATAPAPPTFDRPVYADHGFDYWRQLPDGRVVLGGWRNLDPASEVGTADVLHGGIQQRMEEFLHRFAPLRGVPVTHRWSGTMGFSKDGLPLVGPVPGAAGALAGVGFTGHGFGFAMLAGQALAATVDDGRHPFCDDLTPYRLR